MTRERETDVFNWSYLL